MKTCQAGDRVQVHYVKRFEDGTVRSSRARGAAPLELTVGTRHPRLPGAGAELVGLAEGRSVTFVVPPGQAHGSHDPTRVRRVSRDRFGKDLPLTAGRLARMQAGACRVRVVRVVSVRGRVVVVDGNHPRAGQWVEVEVELVAIVGGTPEVGSWGP